MTQYEYYITMKALCEDSARFTSDKFKKTMFQNAAIGFENKAISIEDAEKIATNEELEILKRTVIDTEERRRFWEEN